MWTLIILAIVVNASGTATTSHSADFFSKEKCEAAAAKYNTPSVGYPAGSNTEVKAFCFQK